MIDSTSDPRRNTTPSSIWSTISCLAALPASAVHRRRPRLRRRPVLQPAGPAVTAGVELRVLLPVFGAPLRFIYAKNLSPLPQDGFEASN